MVRQHLAKLNHNSYNYFSSEALSFTGKAAEEPRGVVNDKESGESNTAKETYHKQVAAKDSALSALMQMINDVKRFTRRVFGIQSRQYQSVKDDVFSRPAKKEEPKAATTPHLHPHPHNTSFRSRCAIRWPGATARRRSPLAQAERKSRT